jgi:hypothetical protein
MHNNIKKSSILFPLTFCYLAVVYYSESLFSLLFSLPIILGTWQRTNIFNVPKAKLIILLLSTPLLIGLLNYETKDVLRDLMIFVNPLITLILGYSLASYISYFNFIRFVLFCAAFYSIQYILFFDFSSFTKSIYEIRNTSIRPNYFTILGLVFIITDFKNLKKYYSIPYVLILVAIFSTAMVLSVSRAFIFAPFIFIITQGIISRKVFFIGLISLLPIILFINSMGNQSKTRSSGPLNEFIDKTFNITSEVKVQTYNSQEEINKNWRGFESFRALLSFSDFSVTKKIIGSGFGHKVELGHFQKLDDKFYNEIPVMHNGFMMVLTKTGIFGLLLFIFITSGSIVRYIFNKTFKKISYSKIENILIGIYILTFLGTFVAGGWLHRSEFIPLIFGAGALMKFKIKMNENTVNRLPYF